MSRGQDYWSFFPLSLSERSDVVSSGVKGKLESVTCQNGIPGQYGGEPKERVVKVGVVSTDESTSLHVVGLHPHQPRSP